MQGLTLNINVFIQELLKTTHLENDAEMKTMLEKEVEQIVFKAVGMNMQPMLANYLEYKFSPETDPQAVLLEAIANSPGAQQDIFNGLERLRSFLLKQGNSTTK